MIDTFSLMHEMDRLIDWQMKNAPDKAREITVPNTWKNVPMKKLIHKVATLNDDGIFYYRGFKIKFPGV